MLSRAHTPDRPDWRILSAQGAVLDQMGRHEEAQRYYATALHIVPDEPTVLSNLGLSYALSKDLPKAEQTLRRATSGGRIDPRTRQNLALVVGLQGRFPEAEAIAAPICRPMRPPPTSPICGRCWRSKTAGSSPRLPSSPWSGPREAERSNQPLRVSAAGARPAATNPNAAINATSNAVRISDVSPIYSPFVPWLERNPALEAASPLPPRYRPSGTRALHVSAARDRYRAAASS